MSFGNLKCESTRLTRHQEQVCAGACKQPWISTYQLNTKTKLTFIFVALLLGRKCDKALVDLFKDDVFVDFFNTFLNLPVCSHFLHNQSVLVCQPYQYLTNS